MENETLEVVPVILSGGTGSRLWPLSRKNFPKQFSVIVENKKSLFQNTVERLLYLKNHKYKFLSPLIITNRDHKYLVLDQLGELAITNPTIILEPSGRNTAPALTIAALELISNNNDPIMIVAPSDHEITHSKKFISAINKSINIAKSGNIVILGISPDQPNTSYGYIHRSDKLNISGGYAVKEFVEKPSIETAKNFLSSGEYYWNSGIFILRASTWLKALKKFKPEIEKATKKAWINKITDNNLIYPSEINYDVILSESIDYAVIEKCPGSCIDLVMVHLEAGWSDLGNWNAVHKILPKDNNNNSIVGDVILHNSKNNLVHSNHRLVIANGIDNLFVIETNDSVFIMHRDQCNNMRSVVDDLEKLGREERNSDRRVLRPWGWYDLLDQGKGFKVKRIMVKPKASLSLQSHEHRAEHWVVVRGKALITNGDKVFCLEANQSTFIPRGQKHRLENPGKVDLEIIEVQSGSYLGEDDIIRYEDIYKRC